MTLENIKAILERLILESDSNRIPAELALRPELAGMKIFQKSLVGCADASDPIFPEMKADFKAYGDMLRLPCDWLPGAKSVISFFLSYTDEIRVCDRPGSPYPSDEWLHARIEGQSFMLKACDKIIAELKAEGYKAIIPSASPVFTVSRDDARAAAGGPLFAANWSERHGAYAAGLGTFGLAKHLITEIGVCGRFGSIITDAPIAPTPRAYSSPYEYCSFCGKCALRCPSSAIGKREKDNAPCSDFINRTKELFPPRYGCGKCQIGMPCENGIPVK
ncbi:MAG: epoxyqueuosine reductase [Oscillospiraceae bacterium]|nr:epoxyqueuosine reductase [Oscillospiraceae bacterium]